MGNYRYELKDIERNHEAYENEGSWPPRARCTDF